MLFKPLNLGEYESAFETVTPIIIQTRSLSDPVLFINEFDYSPMEEFSLRGAKRRNILSGTMESRSDRVSMLGR